MQLKFVGFAALALVGLAACGGPSASEQAAAPAASTPAQTAEAPAPAAPVTPKLTLADLPAPWSAADIAAGEAAFPATCGVCHQVDPAMGNMVGPNLHGMFARAPGGLGEFRYSDAIKAHAAAVPQWTPEELDKWLADPKGYLPGSAMFFNGITDPAARQNLIAWLMIATS